jgi:hypothetical protein
MAGPLQLRCRFATMASVLGTVDFALRLADVAKLS